MAWCRRHADEIERDMNEVASRKRGRQPGARRRTELSVAPRAKVAIYRLEDAEGGEEEGGEAEEESAEEEAGAEEAGAEEAARMA